MHSMKLRSFRILSHTPSAIHEYRADKKYR